jgi:succinate dehydrogenase / fumarate reductase cytochrome b subunit
MTTAVKRRPKYLDLRKIQLPIPGLVSILHRISGAVLFLLFIPLGLFALQASLASEQEFSAWTGFFAKPLPKLILVGFIWAWVHHLLAGIRYLLLDLHIGVELQPARLSSKIVLVLSLAITLLLAIKLW